MSSLKQRTEKDCLNCNAEVAGKFCQVCGQENVSVQETFLGMVTHFFNDITHFDGKFFSTLRYLMFNPGFVSSEYIKGRRMSYLNPIRMYLFTSAVFFLVFFNTLNIEKNIRTDNVKFYEKTEKEIEAMDSLQLLQFSLKINPGKPLSRQQIKERIDKSKQSGFSLTGTNYRSKQQYDSLLASGKKQHNWWQKKLIYREIELNKKYNNDKNAILKDFATLLFHQFPQMLFVSLPLFALGLQLLYIRHKRFFYTNHLIFSVHLYIFFFICLLGVVGLKQLSDYPILSGFSNVLQAILYCLMFFYEYKAMRNFYQQRRAKTVIKFILVSMLHSIMIMLLFLGFIIFSYLKV